VDELRLHDVEDALVVGDDQRAHAGLRRDGVDAFGDRVERVDVQAGVRLVEQLEERGYGWIRDEVAAAA
jgi:hypothetical protein